MSMSGNPFEPSAPRGPSDDAVPPENAAVLDDAAVREDAALPGDAAVPDDAAILDDAEVPDDAVLHDEPAATDVPVLIGADIDHDPTDPVIPDVPVQHPAPPGAWHILVRALRPRGTRAQVLTAVLCGLLGFAVVAQVRLTHDTSLSTLRQSDLVEILDQATRQADELQREAAALEQTRQELESGSNSRQAALDAATRSAATQGILTGRLPAEGPGIVVTLTEPGGSIRPLTLLNFLEELRNSGAEAVQLNDQRLTASSYFVAPADGDGVVVDGTTLHAPYRWIVIGDADVMATALEIPGGALASVRNDGGRGSVLRKELVSVTATRSVPTPVNATPVPPKG
jgi:uncharacterized protein YlxW (UPF0749 family)